MCDHVGQYHQSFPVTCLGHSLDVFTECFKDAHDVKGTVTDKGKVDDCTRTALQAESGGHFGDTVGLLAPDCSTRFSGAVGT